MVALRCNNASLATVNSKDRGVTFLELMFTLAIIAVIVTIGVPSFNTMIASNRISSYSNALLGALSTARSESVVRGLRVVVCRSANATAAAPTCVTGGTNAGHWEVGWLVFVDANNDAAFSYSATNKVDTLIRVQGQLSGSITLTSNDASTTLINDYISYAPNGRPLVKSSGAAQCSGATSCVISLCDSSSGRKTAIVINAVGRARTDPNSAVCP